MATLSDMRTEVSRKLRDTSNEIWTTTEVDDAINQGIDALAAFYPREIVSNFATVAAGVQSYAASSFTNIYRIEQYSGTTFKGVIPHGIGGGDSGWESHGSVIYLPAGYTFTTGYVLRAYGYGAYVQLSASTQTTDLDTSGQWAVKVFAQVECISALLNDRVKFQQWQVDTNSTDVTLLALTQTYNSLRSKWNGERQRLKRMRKLD